VSQSAARRRSSVHAVTGKIGRGALEIEAVGEAEAEHDSFAK